MGIVQSIIALGPWAWVILGLILFGLELLAPGHVFLWIGLSALTIGMVEFAVDLPWQAEVIGFGVLSLASVLVYRVYFRGQAETSDRPFLNQRADALVGRRCLVHEPIRNGAGKVKVDDTVWRVRGPDLPKGAPVRIAGADGALLTVEADGD